MGEQIETLTPRADAAEIIRQDTHYGFYCGGDPRDFHPDGESCTEAEIENHRKACALWDEAVAKGETPTPENCSSGWNEDHTVHILRATYGIGVTQTEEPSGTVPLEVARDLERECAALRESRWQPIESAPKDGRVIMGWIGMPWFFCWTEEHGWHGVFPMENAYSLMWLRFSANQPTHWQPLPEPPAARRALGKEGE